ARGRNGRRAGRSTEFLVGSDPGGSAGFPSSSRPAGDLGRPRSVPWAAGAGGAIRPPKVAGRGAARAEPPWDRPTTGSGLSGPVSPRRKAPCVTDHKWKYNL